MIALRDLFRPLVLAAAVVASMAVLSQSVQAQSVDDILKKKKITIGILADYPPFGFTNEKNELDGYDIEVGKLMAKYLGVEAEIVGVTGPNRIPYLLTNKVDVLIATFGITPERAKQVQFSIPYSSIDILVLADKDQKITSAAELSGKRVAVTRASTQDTALSAAAPKDAQLMRFDDDATAAQALLSGQVDAMGVSSVVAAQIQKQNPAKGYEVKFVMRRQPNGVAIRRGQADLLQWVNTFIYFVKNNGELDALHQKWLGAPLPNLPVF
ncbi:transporter substrate-binding domain-containing protein [Azospirillum sp. sgz301742]